MMRFAMVCWEVTPGLRFAAAEFVVIAPECAWSWTQVPHGWVSELVETFRACQWIDSNRIYLTGCSMGGMGTWMIGAQRPDLFAAVAPVASYHKSEYREFIAHRLASM